MGGAKPPKKLILAVQGLMICSVSMGSPINNDVESGCSCTQVASSLLVLCCGLHPRLGLHSATQHLQTDVIRYIGEMLKADEQATLMEMFNQKFRIFITDLSRKLPICDEGAYRSFLIDSGYLQPPGTSDEKRYQTFRKHITMYIFCSNLEFEEMMYVMYQSLIKANFRTRPCKYFVWGGLFPKESPHTKYLH
jgi:hypothetical protein